MNSIRDKALALLARREHSRHELATKLSKRGYASDEIEATLSLLVKSKLQSDQRFCESYVRYRKNLGWGPLKVSAELGARKVNSTIIDQEVGASLADWRQSIVLVWKKRFNARQPESIKEKARQVRFLLGRGFPSDWVYSLLDNRSCFSGDE